jgi:AcrR family transcriptional regulator
MSSVAVGAGGRGSRPSRDTSEQATRRRVIDAAVSCILERGFYRASSNEIARRAGVTWGVIQHHFGTREALMLAVLEDVARASIDGTTVTERVSQLLDILAAHYGTPEYLAYLQVAMNMDHDPATSAHVRATMDSVAERTTERLRKLLRSALGRATSVPDLANTVFLALRGFAVSQHLLEVMAYDTVVPESDRVARQRRLLVQMLVPYLEQAAREAP